MKIRRSFLVPVFAVVALSLVICVVRQHHSSPATTQRAAVSQAEKLSVQTNGAQQQIGHTPTNAARSKVATMANQIKSMASSIRTKASQAKQGLATLNDQQIVFFGKVVDQFGAPVASATVNASVQVNNGIRSGVDRFSLTSDEMGLFKIDGYTGKTLAISVIKDGYVMSTTNTLFIYSAMWSPSERYSPDPENPTVITMYKTQGAQPLLNLRQRYKVTYSDQTLKIDLLTHRLVDTGGDLEMTIKRANGEVSGRMRKEWSVKIAAPTGGLIPVEFNIARVTYVAPNDGYLGPQLLIMSTNAPNNWYGAFDRTYFLKSRGGQVYAKVNITVGINRLPEDKVAIEISGWANTNASQNWEATISQ